MRTAPCCKAKIRRFSGRRRQCVSCLRTWRVRPKKRGRRRRRSDNRLIQRVLCQQRTLTQLALTAGLTRQTLSARFRKVLRCEYVRPAPATNHIGDLILLADGLWFRFGKIRWVLHLMALRPVKGEVAVFLDPVLLEGREDKLSWLKAMSTIPKAYRRSIRALVGDKFSGCVDIARQNGWVLQLCHFHLLAQLKGHSSNRATTTVPNIRHGIHSLLRKTLRTADKNKRDQLIGLLKVLLSDPATPATYKSVVRGFFRSLDRYHAFIHHPQLLLPTTNGSSEAMGRRVRDMLDQTRSLSTPTALDHWVRKQIRLKPAIACRPGLKNQPN